MSLQNLPKAPVNLATGSVQLKIGSSDLLQLAYYNLYSLNGQPTTPNTGVGNSWSTAQFAKLSVTPTGAFITFTPGRGGKVLRFTRDGDQYSATNGATATLQQIEDSGNYRLTEYQGKVSIFDIASGLIKSSVAPDGTETDYAIDPLLGRVSEIRSKYQAGGKDIVDRRTFDYITTGPCAGQLTGVTLARATAQTTGSPFLPADSDFVDVTGVVLEYYDVDLPGRGCVKDLKFFKQTKLSGNFEREVRTHYFRYYTEPFQANGVHPGHRCGLKFAFTADEFFALNTSPDVVDTLIDDNIADVAGINFEYDAEQRVSIVRRDGGRVENKITYEVNATPDTNDRFNTWVRKVTYDQPDDTVRTVYSNAAGQDILVEDTTTDGGRWIHYYRFDDRGNQIEKCYPSAVISFNESRNDLGVQLKSSEGKIEITHWRSSSNDPVMQLVKKGASGRPIPLSKTDYLTYTLAAGTAEERSAHVVCKRTVYQTDDGVYDESCVIQDNCECDDNIASCVTGGTPAVTKYDYLWHSGSLQPSRITTTLPRTEPAQNGLLPTQDDQRITTYDTLGRMLSQTDARGTVTEYQYDTATGAMLQSIQDAGAGGLNLTTDYEVDNLGRSTQVLGPRHLANGQSVRTANWTVYISEYETWSAKGYLDDSDLPVLVNPIQVSRRSADGTVNDKITLTRGNALESPGRLLATDELSTDSKSNAPNARASWTAWSQTISDANGRMLESRVYFNIPPAGSGFSGLHYNATTYKYDLLDRQTQTTTADGTITQMVYDLRSLPVSTWIGTNANGATDFDPTGAGSSGNVGNDMVLLSENEYDNNENGFNGLLTKVTTPQNDDPAYDRVSSQAYDWRDRQIGSVTAGPAEDLVSSQTLDNLGRNIISQTLSRDAGSQDMLISQSTTLYDDRSRSYRSIQHGVNQDTGVLTGETITSNQQYDPESNLLKQSTVGVPDFMEYVYDAIGRQTHQSNALDHTRETKYNEVSQAILQIDALGHSSFSTYDAIGRMIGSTNREAESTSVEYDIAGRVSVQVDASDNRTEVEYDDASRQIMVTDADGHESSTSYDEMDRVLVATDPNEKTVSYEYDFRGRQVKVTDQVDDMTRSVYDRASNVIQSIDAKDEATDYQFDSMGRMFRMTDRINAVTQYAFDRASRQKSVTDAEDNTTTYAFDSFGRPATTTYPDHVAGSSPGNPGYGVVRLEYDLLHRPLRKTDQQGDTVTNNYDVAGRLIRRDYRNRMNSPIGIITDSDVFTFDRENRMLTALSNRYDNRCTMVYDDIGRTTRETLTLLGHPAGGSSSPLEYVTMFEYDVPNSTSRIIYPNGAVVERHLNSRNLLSEVRLDNQVIDSRLYDPIGRLSSCAYGNGLATVFNYRSDHLVSQIASPGVGEYGYTYDQNKNKTSETISDAMSGFGFDTGPTNTDGYDDQDRLVAWNRTDEASDNSWLLRPVGHWETATQGTRTTAYQHGPSHEIELDGTKPITYDAKGNRVTSIEGTSNFQWDFNNQLRVADDHEFQYDALGRRVTITVGFNTTILICPNSQLIATYDYGAAPASPNQTFVYGSYIDEPIAMTDSTGNLLYFSRNQQYSVTALTDSDAEVVERYAYSAYGETLILSPDATETRTTSDYGNPFGFTGRYNHQSLGLMYFRARYYHSQLGQFISRDPLEYVDGMSQYRAYFVPGSMDPLGMKKACKCKVFDAYDSHSHTDYRYTNGKCSDFDLRSVWLKRTCVEISNPSPPPVGTLDPIMSCVVNCFTKDKSFDGNRLDRINACKGRCRHRHRNIKNQCPARKPTPGVKDSAGNVWKRDDPLGEWWFHDSLDCFRSGHFQCCYDCDGDVVTRGPFQGTYDYEVFNPDTGENRWPHNDEDVKPHNGDDDEYFDDETTVY